MVANGINKETAQKLWEFIVPFARYGFNRSHAACYAMISYQTAYLKAHFPAQFMAALLTADLGDIDKVSKEVHECNKMGLRVLPPDVNESFTTFAVVPNADGTPSTTLRFGLNAIKNVGEHISEAIIEERKAHGHYTDLEDLLKRITDKDLNKKSLESLIKAGALDAFGERGQLLANLETFLAFNKKIQTNTKLGKSDLFADLPVAVSTKLKLAEAEPVANWIALGWEKELLGLYVSDHPFKSYLPWLKGAITTLKSLRNQEGADVTVAGVITNIHKILTKAGDPMLFVTIEDSTDATEIIIFPKLLAKTQEIWQPNVMVIANGKVSDKDGSPKLLTESVSILTEEVLQRYQKQTGSNTKLWITLPAGTTKNQLEEVKQALTASNGHIPVYMIMSNGTTKKIKTSFSVTISDQLKFGVEKVLGEGCWVVEER
jgi:DNA polymerase-3 subunit alpha